jgi:hypothetical protein
MCATLFPSVLRQQKCCDTTSSDARQGYRTFQKYRAYSMHWRCQASRHALMIEIIYWRQLGWFVLDQGLADG